VSEILCLVTCVRNSVFSNLCPKFPSVRKCGKIMYRQADHTWQYGACSLHAAYLRLQTQTQNTQHLSFFHCNIGFTDATQCYTKKKYVNLWTYCSRSQWPHSTSVGPQPLACWDCGFESRQRHVCLSVLSVVCWQVEVSETIWPLVQRSPTDCGASLCVI